MINHLEWVHGMKVEVDDIQRVELTEDLRHMKQPRIDVHWKKRASENCRPVTCDRFFIQNRFKEL